MGPKRRRTKEGENQQPVQKSCSIITRALVKKINNTNSPVLVFAHGAGAPSSSEWMIRWKKLLGDALNAVEVVTFDYPYISERKPPPKAEKLIEFHSGIVKKIACKYPQHPVILVGKSMGSRVSCMVAAQKDIEASAVVCLGYPLKGTKGAIRDEPLLQLTVPTMFVQGSKDGMCPLELLEAVRKKMKALNRVHVVENGDHSFKIGKKNLELAGMTHEEAEGCAVEAIAKLKDDKRSYDPIDYEYIDKTDFWVVEKEPTGELSYEDLQNMLDDQEEEPATQTQEQEITQGLIDEDDDGSEFHLLSDRDLDAYNTPQPEDL